MEFHKLAEIFPEMGHEEFEALKADIQKHGQIEPILTSGGVIVDGRHRFKACQELGIEPQFTAWEGTEDDLIWHVLSLNIRRRHLKESQRAMVASKIAILDKGQRAKEEISLLGQKEAGLLFNVSKASIQFARTVYDSKDAELIDAVFNGKMAVSKARNEIKKRERQAQQPAPVKKMTREYLQQRGIILTKLPAQELLAAIDDGAIDLVCTDPPYNAGIAAWDTGFDPHPFLLEFSRVLRPGGSAIIFCHDKLIAKYLASPLVGIPPSSDEIKAAKKNLEKAQEKDDAKATKEAEKAYKKLLADKKRAEEKPLCLVMNMFWHKTNNKDSRKLESQRNTYTPTIENIIWLKKPGARHVWNKPEGFQDLFGCGKRIADLIQTPMVSGYQGAEANRYTVGESPKPFRLMEMLIKSHSDGRIDDAPPEIILDPFHGKGVTALVAYMTGRNCITGEMDERKVLGVHEWRVTDMFQFIAQSPELVNKPLTLEAMKKVQAVKNILRKNELLQGGENPLPEGEEQTALLEKFRHVYIYHRYINDILRKHPEFKRLAGGKKDDELKAERQKEWLADGLLDYDYLIKPTNLDTETIHPLYAFWNSPELAGRQISPFNPPESDPLRQAYERKFGEKCHPYVFDVLPIGEYQIGEISSREPTQEEIDSSIMRNLILGICPTINPASKRGKKLVNQAAADKGSPEQAAERGKASVKEDIEIAEVEQPTPA